MVARGIPVNKYKTVSIIALIVLVGIYMLRVSDVNNDNDKAKIHYMDDCQIVKTNYFEYSISEQRLYDTAAFVSDFPTTSDYYASLSEYYKAQGLMETFLENKYVLCIKMTVKNCSTKLRDVDMLGNHIYIGKSYHNGLDPYLLQDVNQFSGLSLRAGHTYSYWVPYVLNRTSFREEHFAHLLNQDFSILISGYPNIQRIRLNHIDQVKATAEQNKAYEKLINMNSLSKEKSLNTEDTKEGTMIPIGGEFVKKGVAVSIDSCEVVKKNVKEKLSDYGNWLDDSENWIKEELDDSGSVICDRKYCSDRALVFVTLSVKNLSGEDQVMDFNPCIVNYTGKGGYESAIAKAVREDISHRQDSAFYTINKNADTKITLVYALVEYKKTKERKKWKIGKERLYLDFAISVDNDADFQKKYYGNGIYLQIK